MNIKAFKNIFLVIGSALFLITSCAKETPQPIITKPDPEPAVFYECPKDGDIFKIIVDTIIFDKNGDLYTTKNKKIPYDYGTIPLGVCAKTADLSRSAKYNPMSAIVKTDEGKTRDMIWDRNGYIKNMIFQEDIKRIQTFPDGKKVSFELSLLNFNRDVIQTSSIVIVYKQDIK